MIYFPAQYSIEWQQQLADRSNLRLWPSTDNYRGLIAKTSQATGKATVIALIARPGYMIFCVFGIPKNVFFISVQYVFHRAYILRSVPQLLSTLHNKALTIFKHPVHAFIYVVLWLISLSYPITSYAQWLIKATPGNKQITLQWPPVKDATNYGVCYATEAIININKCLNYAGGTWRNVTGTTIKITRLSNGKKYYFRVLAENSMTRLGVGNTIAARPNKITSLNDTGINNEQCYQLGSNTLVACTSAAATALSNSQDGMVGRDVTADNGNDGRAGFSFTDIPHPVTWNWHISKYSVHPAVEAVGGGTRCNSG